jgi:hypothetical protein
MTWDDSFVENELGPDRGGLHLPIRGMDAGSLSEVDGQLKRRSPTSNGSFT